MNIKTYISSGILESYVLGLATSEEIAELELMRLRYPDLDIAIRECEYQIEKSIRLMDVPPPPEKVKQQIMLNLQHALELQEAGDKDKSDKIHYIPVYSLHNNNKIRVAAGWKVLFIAMLVMIVASLLAVIILSFLSQ